MVNRITFYIRRKRKRCYLCNTKVHGTIWDKDGDMILSPSNGGLAGIIGKGPGYVCIPCLIKGFTESHPAASSYQ